MMLTMRGKIRVPHCAPLDDASATSSDIGRLAGSVKIRRRRSAGSDARRPAAAMSLWRSRVIEGDWTPHCKSKNRHRESKNRDAPQRT
jgi:hypothetical protein